MPRLALVAGLLVLPALPALPLVPAASGSTTGSFALPGDLPAATAEATGVVDVAVANLREGTLVRRPADLRGDADRERLAARILDRPGPAPDVVLLQEVLGSADRAATALSAGARQRGLDDRYAVVTRTLSTTDTGRCQGEREGRYAVLRSSAVLVNTATVTDVGEQGVVRTWGRWFGEARRVTRRAGYGCAEQPWVRLTVSTPSGPVTATVMSVHVPPSKISLKNQAIAALGEAYDDVTSTVPTDLAFMGGDFNLDRCVGGGDRAGCELHPGHAALLDDGYRDVVREHQRTGRDRTTGVDRRIDFVFTKNASGAGWWDRCYQAYRVLDGDCDGRATFARSDLFTRCEARADEAPSPGGGCPRSAYGRYSSDHPLVTASIRAGG